MTNRPDQPVHATTDLPIIGYLSWCVVCRAPVELNSKPTGSALYPIVCSEQCRVEHLLTYR